MNNERSKITPPDIARLWGISVDKVLAWIRSGELSAINAATNAHGRPRYLVDIKELRAFERRRSVNPSTPPDRKRTKTAKNVIEFF